MVSYRSVALLALVLVVATAGCTAGPGGPPYASPLDAATVAAGHRAALDDAGSYTVVVNSSATFLGKSMPGTSIRAAVDGHANRGLVTAATAIGNVSTYVDDGTVYQRLVAGTTQYQVANRSVDLRELFDPHVEGPVANVTFVANGTTTLGGERVWVYRANATGPNATLDQPIVSGVTTSAVDTVLYVRSDGLVRRAVTNATVADSEGNRYGTYVSSVTYERVGSTTVDPPAWIAAARNATAGRTTASA